MPRGVDITSPETAYVTKDNIVYPSYAPTQAQRQAQADEVEVQAVTQKTAQGSVNGTQGPGGAAPGALLAGAEPAAMTGITATFADDVFTLAAHGLSNGDRIVFTSITGGTGYAVTTVYFVRDVTTNTFKLALTLGGAVVDLTASNITAATAFRLSRVGEASFTAIKRDGLIAGPVS